MEITEFANLAGIDNDPAAIKTALYSALTDTEADAEIDDSHERFHLHVAIIQFAEDRGWIVSDDLDWGNTAQVNNAEWEAILRMRKLLNAIN